MCARRKVGSVLCERGKTGALTIAVRIAARCLEVSMAPTQAEEASRWERTRRGDDANIIDANRHHEKNDGVDVREGHAVG